MEAEKGASNCELLLFTEDQTKDNDEGPAHDPFHEKVAQLRGTSVQKHNGDGVDARSVGSKEPETACGW